MPAWIVASLSKIASVSVFSLMGWKFLRSFEGVWVNRLLHRLLHRLLRLLHIDNPSVTVFAVASTNSWSDGYGFCSIATINDGSSVRDAWTRWARSWRGVKRTMMTNRFFPAKISSVCGYCGFMRNITLRCIQSKFCKFAHLHLRSASNSFTTSAFSAWRIA